MNLETVYAKWVAATRQRPACNGLIGINTLFNGYDIVPVKWPVPLKLDGKLVHAEFDLAAVVFAVDNVNEAPEGTYCWNIGHGTSGWMANSENKLYLGNVYSVPREWWNTMQIQHPEIRTVHDVLRKLLFDDTYTNKERLSMYDVLRAYVDEHEPSLIVESTHDNTHLKASTPSND